MAKLGEDLYIDAHLAQIQLHHNWLRGSDRSLNYLLPSSTGLIQVFCLLNCFIAASGPIMGVSFDNSFAGGFPQPIAHANKRLGLK